ncbi:MAG: aminotransferase class V-fold PLP-dependent enzyme, partial [Gaiellaceae bacterium]
SWEHWGVPGEEARASFARMVGVPVETVAIGPNVSSMIGLVAASIPDGARVLAPDVEFTSLLFPFLVQERRGVSVRLVPTGELAGEIDRDVDVVAFSAVQMATGEVADLDAIAQVAHEHSVLTVVDATQAVGWLPIDASRFDVVAAHGYKWLLSPRGTAYMAIRSELMQTVVPGTAGWYAGEDPLATFFGPPLRLAASARRLDTSPAWFMWAASAPALATLEEIGIDTIHAHDVALANRFRADLGLEPGDSAIVMSDAPGTAEKLERAGIQAAVRGGRLRTSWHVYNTEGDVDRTLDALSA